MVKARNINRLRQLEQPQTEGLAAQRRSRASEGRAKPERKDQVVLSDHAQALLRLQETAARTPDVRTEKVQALREAIARGDYEVPARAIAEKMLDSEGAGS